MMMMMMMMDDNDDDIFRMNITSSGTSLKVSCRHQGLLYGCVIY